MSVFIKFRLNCDQILWDFSLGSMGNHESVFWSSVIIFDSLSSLMRLDAFGHLQILVRLKSRSKTDKNSKLQNKTGKGQWWDTTKKYFVVWTFSDQDDLLTRKEILSFDHCWSAYRVLPQPAYNPDKMMKIRETIILERTKLQDHHCPDLKKCRKYDQFSSSISPIIVIGQAIRLFIPMLSFVC